MEQKAPKDFPGQLIIVLDQDPIQKMSAGSMQYRDNASGELFPVPKEVLYSREYDVQRKSKYAVLGLRSTMASSVKQLLGSSLPAKTEKAFVRQYAASTLPRTYLVESPGGSAYFSEVITNENERLEKKGTPTISFIRDLAASAALNVTMSTPDRYATPDSRFLWHYGRFATKPDDLMTSIALSWQERKDGQRDAEQFEEFLRANVNRSKVNHAVAEFREARGDTDHEFKAFGSKFAEWGLVTLFGKTRMPEQEFTRLTGIDATTLEEKNPIRSFIRWLETSMERQNRRTPLF